MILDGVILNKLELMSAYHKETWTETALEMYKKNETWFRDLRGAFAGAVLDKKKQLWYCFTDHCGAHLLMTCHSDGNTAFGSQVNYFSDWMDENGIEKKVDEEWAHDLIHFGFMRESYSILQGVTRVYPRRRKDREGTPMEYT